MIETIEWHDVRLLMPDDASTVLIYAPDSTEPVWFGWHEDSTWFTSEGVEQSGVQAWAEMPGGPALRVEFAP